MSNRLVLRRMILAAAAVAMVFGGGCALLAGLDDHSVYDADAAAGSDAAAEGSLPDKDAAASITFDPPFVEILGNASVPVKIRLNQDTQGDVEVRFDVVRDRTGLPDAGSAGDAGAAAVPTTDPSSVTLSNTIREATVVVRSAPGVLTTRYALTASAKLGATSVSGVLPIQIVGAPGTLDTSFGTQGGYLDFQPEGNSEGSAVMPLPDGRFIVVGIAGQFTKLFAARFFADGTLDTSYGTSGGMSVFSLAGITSQQRSSAALLADGSVVVAMETGGGQDVRVAHVRADGKLDLAWGGADAGVLAAASVRQSQPRQSGQVPLAVRSNGSFVVGGTAQAPETGLVRQFLPDGGVDTAFGNNGLATVAAPNGLPFTYVRAFHVQDGGSTLTVGGDALPDGGGQYDQFGVQMGPNGATAGSLAEHRFSTGVFSGLTAIAQQDTADGRTTLLGAYNVPTGGDPEITILRYGPSFPKTSLGSLSIDAGASSEVGTFVVLPGDTFLINNGFYASKDFFILAVSGSTTLAPDQKFGNGGRFTSIPGQARSMALDGRTLLVAGVKEPGGGNSVNVRVARYWVR